MSKFDIGVSEEVEKVLNKVKKDLEIKKFPDFSSYTFSKIEIFVNNLVKKLFPELTEVVTLDLPPSGVKGDFSFGTFVIAKKLGQSPIEVANQIVEAINKENGDLIEKVENMGPFVNLFLNQNVIFQNILEDALRTGDQFGESNVNKGKTVFVDYCAVNIAKPMGVGHLRSTIIGQSLSNIYEATGYSAIRDNHLGDWGTQFGALIYAYQNWLIPEEFAKDPIKHLKDLYVKFHEEEESRPEIRDEARQIFARLEKGDPEMVKLWQDFKEISLKSFEPIYKRLGINFDLFIGESFFIDKTDEVIKASEETGLTKRDLETNALVVEIGDIPTFLLQKGDGSSLYLTRDLASLKYRVETFNADTLLYVVGLEQELHFKQLFALADKLGYLKNIIAKYIGFGMVLTGGKKMSTRKGTLIQLEDLLDEAKQKAKEIIQSKNRDISGAELEETAEKIGTASIIYNDLRHTKQKNISFDWETMLSFEAGSVAYLEYSYVRIKSIFKKLAQENFTKPTKFVFENESEFNLAKKLMFFPIVTLKAQKDDSPHVVCTYLEELAQIFSVFYEETSISKTEKLELLNSRLYLLDTVAKTLKKGLALLNIQTVERM